MYLNRLRHHAHSLVVRIIMLGVLMLVVGTMGRMVALSHYLGNDIRDQNGKQLLALSEFAAAQIGGNIAQQRDTLQRMAVLLAGRLNQPKAVLSKQLADIHVLNPFFSEGLVWLDPAGQVLASSAPHLPGSHALLLAGTHVQQARQGGFAIGRPAAIGADARAVLPMAVAVQSADTRGPGVLVGLVALDDKGFISALRDTRVGQAGGLILVSPQDGLFLAASHRHITLVPTPPAGRHAQHDEAMNGARGVAVDVNSAGEEELAATASVPGSTWFVVARQPTNELLAPLDNQKRRMLNGTAGMLFVMVLILIWGLRHVFKPLVSAADHADRMTRDEEPLAPLRVVRNDEVGHLTAAFNRLLDKLLETQAALSNMAHHDTLTGLPNRTLLADVLMRALARAHRNGTEVAVLFIDLDGFKPINDAHGHACGDEALQQVAQRLTSAIRHADTVARIGGDEFVILLSDLPAGDRAGVQHVAEKCLGTFAQPFRAKGHACRLGASVGIAMGHGDTPPDTLMSAADTAMYSAKQAGKGQVVWATPDNMSAGA